MKNRPRLACKIACFCRQKEKQFACRTTGIASKNPLQTQAKKTTNTGKKPAIAGKAAVTPPVNSPANCR